ncbi:unnamed protein product [Caretta caretta]
MADVIHPDQTYTVPGRSIFDNLFLVRDLLELGRRDGLSFALLSLDQEKAFDRVDHGYLLSTLQAFGFGPQFVSFLRVLYASVECLVRLNWTLTEPVSFGRGVRQGCPLSGQLYALAIEPFLCLLRRRMTGLVLREPELRLVLSAYADDVLLVVQDPGDLARVEACQAIYSAASSARVNWVKSSGLAVGDWRQEKAFDRVDHGYLLSTLQAFGFGPQFVSFLRVLYASVECLVRLNWTLTEPVSFGRGVRQGCPLSGQLYALAIEPFLCLLRRRMTGLVLREPELRLVLSAYADDVLLVVQDPGDLARVEACQAIYLAASSARVNWVKSSGLAVGDWRQSETFWNSGGEMVYRSPSCLLIRRRRSIE